MKIKWINSAEITPKRSGFYFVKCFSASIFLFYYYKPLNIFLDFDFDCALMYYWESSRYIEWAKMPRLSIKKLLHDGYISIEK